VLDGIDELICDEKFREAAQAVESAMKEFPDPQNRHRFEILPAKIEQAQEAARLARVRADEERRRNTAATEERIKELVEEIKNG